MILKTGSTREIKDDSEIFVAAVIGVTFLCLFTPYMPGCGLAAFAQDRPTNSFAWEIQRVDAPKLFSSMRDRTLCIDANGHPHIAYGGDYLYYAWHDGAEWHLETVDTSEGVGSWASLSLDVNGNPHISYYDDIKRLLKYAHKTESGWEIQTVDSNWYVGSHTSIVLDIDGNPHIAYCDGWVLFTPIP